MLTAYGVKGVAKERVLTLARAAISSGLVGDRWQCATEATAHANHIRGEATKITNFEPRWCPGLLQTHAYMRAVMESVRGADLIAEPRVSARAGRQTVLYSQEATALYRDPR